MKIFISIFFIFGMLWAQDASYQEFEDYQHSKPYVVKKGDTLSKILEKHGYKKLFKKKGVVIKAILKNGLSKGGNKLEVGDVIFLPVKRYKYYIREHNQNIENNDKTQNIELDREVASVESIEAVKEDIIKKIIINKHIVDLSFDNLGAQYNTTNAESDSSELYSKTLTNLNLDYTLVRDENFYFAGISMSSLNLEEVEGGEISSTSFSHTYYKIGIGREFKNKFRLSIAYEQSPLLYSEDSSDSELNLLYDGLSQYTFALDRNFLLGSKFSLTPFFSYSFIPNSSLGTYEINSGDNFLLGANLYYLKENFKLYTGTFYKQRRLNKEDTTDRDINIGFRFGVMFNY